MPDFLDPDFLERVFYHNTVRTWLIAAGVMTGVVVALWLVRRLLLGRLDRLAKRTHTDFDDLVVDVIRRTSVLFRIFLALTAGSLVLALPAGTRTVVRVVAVLALLVQTGIWGNGIVRFLTARYVARHSTDGTSATTITALSYGARFLLYVVLFLLALDNLGINITALVAGLGIGGIAVALAVQNILGDLFGALSIVLDKPFVVGDFIVVDTFSGTVEHIGLKTTRLRSIEGEQIVIANAELLRSRIRNYKRMYERRVVFLVSVTYDTPPDTVERIPGIIRDIVNAQAQVRIDRAHFKRFADSALEFETVYYMLIADYTAMMDTQQAIAIALMRRFREEGIEFAFPSRTVYVRTPEEAAAIGGG